jgi:hypothetical protein
MRLAVLATEKAPISRWGRGTVEVLGTIDTVARLRIRLGDREANDEAGPGERVVRLPRRLSRRILQLGACVWQLSDVRVLDVEEAR